MQSLNQYKYDEQHIFLIVDPFIETCQAYEERIKIHVVEYLEFWYVNSLR